MPISTRFHCAAPILAVSILALQSTPQADVGRQPEPSWNSTGSELDWAKSWATDTFKSFPKACRGIAPVDLLKHDHRTPFGLKKGYDITRPATYEADMTTVVDQQLAKGGYRLAKLLDVIWHDKICK